MKKHKNDPKKVGKTIGLMLVGIFLPHALIFYYKGLLEIEKDYHESVKRNDEYYKEFQEEIIEDLKHREEFLKEILTSEDDKNKA